MSERYDLVVVGAGPGGASTAYHASKAGLKTLLLDRQEFPRDKTCGDGLMPHAANEVAMMGLGDWLDEPHHGRFRGFSIFTRTAEIRQGVPPTLHGPHGYVVRREETDAKLLERAKAAGAPGPRVSCAPRRVRSRASRSRTAAVPSISPRRSSWSRTASGASSRR